ncbi:MAG TPA: PIG-L family deacetylase [Rhodothermales bacterium]|nr:PIG-L family deacetylase [Rhodothermales bacterium]
MRRQLILFLSLGIVTLASVRTARAQEEHRPLVVMNLAAHPDDEDGSTLTYYRKAKNAVAYSVIFTRGEGGQNEIGPELYQALGAIRTKETERAARMLGTQVRFLNFYDFGYTKHAYEAFDKWGGRDSVEARLVYVIRKLKPDVMFTNHDTVTVGPRRQHGQHQAVGIAAYDAFTLAADPNYHPEQLEEPGVDLWQPKRLFLRHYSQPDRYDVAVPVGDTYQPAGKSYTDIAMDALREHASQGMGMFANRRRPPATFFTLERSATNAPLDPTDLAGNLPPNSAATPDVSYLIDSGRIPPLSDALVELSDSIAMPGQNFELRFDPAKLPSGVLRWTFEGAVDTTLLVSSRSAGSAMLTVSLDANPTIPAEHYQYTRFLDHPPVIYEVHRQGSDDLVAAGYLPLQIAPPAVVHFRDEAVRLEPGRNALPVQAQVFDPSLHTIPLTIAVADDSTRNILAQSRYTLAVPPRTAVDDTLWIDLPSDLSPGSYTVLLSGLVPSGTSGGEVLKAEVQARAFDVAVAPTLKVGVIRSYDDTMARALKELGVDYVMLDSAALASHDLDGLNTIVVDIRSYLVRPDLRRYNDRLLDWVEHGGNLIVNYQKTYEWNPSSSDPFMEGRNNPPDLAPYPLILSHDRVTYEDAPIELLKPASPIFNRPNKIRAQDWNGWVQERGLYFPTEYDDRYTELISTHDPGEAPLKGGMLLAKYGDGTYLYTSLVWYRQLKQQNPGAYRVFANMLSLPLVDGRSSASAH